MGGVKARRFSRVAAACTSLDISHTRELAAAEAQVSTPPERSKARTPCRLERRRYGATRRSRNQKSKLNKPQRRDRRRGSKSRIPLCVHRVSAVRCPLRKFARPATIWPDTHSWESALHGWWPPAWSLAVWRGVRNICGRKLQPVLLRHLDFQFGKGIVAKGAGGPFGGMDGHGSDRLSCTGMDRGRRFRFVVGFRCIE